MNAHQILAKLDAYSMDASNPRDGRRVISEEANALRAAIGKRDAIGIKSAMDEAVRVLGMWS